MATILDTLLVRIGPEIFGTDGLRRLESKIASASAKLDSFAAGAGRVGAAITAVGAATLTAFANQESKWTEVSGKTGKSVDDLKSQYADAAKAISNDTGIALTTILDGFQKAISAGTEGEEAIRLVGEGAKAQAANITSMEEAISAATTAAVAFGEDPVVALNKMIRAAQVGEGDTEDYARSIKGLLQQAKPTGVAFDELAGTLAATAQQTKSVAEAETQINSFLRGMISPSAAAKKALEEMSGGLVSFDDVQKQLKTEGLAAVVGSLQTMTGMDPTQIAALFPEAEAQKFFNTADPAVIAQLTAEVEAGAKAIPKAFAEGAQDIERLLGQTREMVKNLAADIGETLKPTFVSLNAVVQDFAAWFDGLGSQAKLIVGHILAMGPILIGAAIAAKAFSFVLGGAAIILAGIRTGLSLLRAALIALRVPMLAFNLIASLNPISLIVLAVAGLIAGLVAVWHWWDDITEMVGKATDAFLDLLREWGVPVDDIFAWLGTAWKAVVDTVTAPIAGLWDWIKGPDGERFAWLTDAWGTMTGGLTVSGVWDWITDRVEAPFQWLTDAWGTMTGGLTVSGVWDWITDRVEAPFQWLTDAWTTMTGGLTVSGVWDWITDRVEAPFQWLTDAWTTMTGGLTVSGVWDWITDRVEAPFQWLTDAWTTMTGGLTVSGVWDWLEYREDAPFQWVSTAWAKIKLTAIDIMSALPSPSDALLWGTQLLDNLTVAIEDTDFRAMGQAIGQGIGGAIRAVAGVVRDAVVGLFDLAFGDGESEEAQKVAAAALTIGTAFINAIKAAFSGLGSLVLGIIEGAFDIDLVASGRALLKSFIDGIKERSAFLGGALERMFTDEVEPKIPSSDAREGPLSRLTQAGRSIVETIADGVRSAPPLREALAAGALALPGVGALAADLGIPDLTNMELPALDALAPPLPIGPVPPQGGGGGGVTLTVTLAEGAIVIHAPGGDADEIAARIGDSLGDEWRALAEQVDSRLKA